MPDRSFLPVILVAFVAGVLFTWIARAIARWRGIVNHPNPIIPQHTTPVAYLGGAAILLALAATFVAAGLFERAGMTWLRSLPAVPWQVALPAVLFAVMGTADDLLGFSPKRKFALQLALSTLTVWLGAALPLTGNTFIDATLSILWFAVMVNAFNLTDVCDGLLAGIACVMLVAIAFLVPEIAALALVCCGVILGFLVFNFPPASIYLGDGGSHLLGFVCAVLLMAGAQRHPPWPYAASAILVAAVPLFELVFLVVVRARKGKAWWKGSPDHFSLRLQKAGLSRFATDVIAWTMAAIVAGLGVAVFRMPEMHRWLSIAAVIVAFAAAWRWLLRFEVDGDG
jgi:UDP-GlcNAc:undecaprenyl-phosphate GlcNAc-1-phosphate transferase